MPLFSQAAKAPSAAVRASPVGINGAGLTPEIHRRVYPFEPSLCNFPQFSLYFSDNANPVTHMNDEILTIREVSELLKINEKTAYRLAAEGKLPGFKVGGSWRFERQEISNWIKRQTEGTRQGSKE